MTKIFSVISKKNFRPMTAKKQIRGLVEDNAHPKSASHFSLFRDFVLLAFISIMALMWNYNKYTNDKNNVFNSFQQYVAPILASPCETFHASDRLPVQNLGFRIAMSYTQTFSSINLKTFQQQSSICWQQFWADETGRRNMRCFKHKYVNTFRTRRTKKMLQ